MCHKIDISIYGLAVIYLYFCKRTTCALLMFSFQTIFLKFADIFVNCSLNSYPILLQFEFSNVQLFPL
jgi:hypothetical protein